MRKRVKYALGGYYRDLQDNEINNESESQESVATEIRKNVPKKEFKGVVASCVCAIVRGEGKPDADIKEIINAGTELTIFLNESNENFYKISYGDGKEGFIHKSLVERR